MKWNWWKILGILFIFISLTVGMLIPLRPGIVGLNPTQITAGQSVQFDLEGYNTNFTKSKETQAWMWLDKEHIIKAKSVQSIDNQFVKVEFDIPNHLPEKEKRTAKISTYDEVNGFITALGRPYIKGGKIEPTLAANQWNAEINNSEKIGGINFPLLPNIYESVRNTFYHVALWFGMFFTFIWGVVHSIQYLRTLDPERDFKASSFTSSGILFGILGLVTGMMWASYTWGEAWSWDIKQTMTAILLLVYLAYFVLRMSFEDDERRARISAIYNIFAFVCIIPLLYVIPRLVDSLHPGGQGNPAFSTGDLDMKVRVLFYMSVLGWCMIGYWMSNLFSRSKKIESYLLENDI